MAAAQTVRPWCHVTVAEIEREGAEGVWGEGERDMKLYAAVAHPEFKFNGQSAVGWAWESAERCQGLSQTVNIPAAIVNCRTWSHVGGGEMGGGERS